MENEKYLFVVSGAAGTGKDSVVKALREAHPEIEKTVSATTRTPREGEKDGINPPRRAGGRGLLLPHPGAVPAPHRHRPGGGAQLLQRQLLRHPPRRGG